MCTNQYLSETVPEKFLFAVTPTKPGASKTAPQLSPLGLAADQRLDLYLFLLLSLLFRPTKQPTFHRVT